MSAHAQSAQTQTAPPRRRASSRVDAVLTAAAVIFSLIGVLAIAVVLIQAAMQARPSALMTYTGMICLPIGFAGMLAVLIRATLRRRSS